MATTHRRGAAPRSSHNLFFALWPGDALRERMASAAAELRETHAPHGRWIDARRYHLTLIFLGHHATLPESLVAAALSAGDAARVPSFDFTLDIAGSFANRSIPWWLGSRSHVPDLVALRESLLNGMRAADAPVRENADHVAHMTILRAAERGLSTTPIDPIAWPVRDFALMASSLGGSASYEVLRRWPLVDGPAAHGER
jgi:RNA 2',3'-cyclic 3'-phosphodiesterase